jgi:hypothetical protein
MFAQIAVAAFAPGQSGLQQTGKVTISWGHIPQVQL